MHGPDDLPTIAQRYLSSVFPWDFVGWLPMQYFDCVPGISGDM
jgi:hypothetical protein